MLPLTFFLLLQSLAAAMSSAFSPPPFLFYPPPSGVEPVYQRPLRAGGPGLLPYLAPFHPHTHHPHHHGAFSVFECPFEPAFIQKRNERERQRVRCVNQGYAKLREHLPGRGAAEKRLSKVETLRAAIRYIKYLQGLVALEDHHSNANSSPSSPPPGDCSEESEVTA